MTLNPIFVPIV